MKFFRMFRLDTANHILWCEEERVPITPRAFDVLTYLVEHAGRVVTQDEVFEALWAETYVNPEILRKYILEVRKALGDRVDSPEFVETLPKRGYRFIAQVVDQCNELVDASTPDAVEEEVGLAAVAVKNKGFHRRDWLWKLALIPLLMIMAVAGIGGYRRSKRIKENVPVPKNASIVVLPFTDMSPAKGQEYFSDGLTEQLINDLAKVSGLKVVGRSSAFLFKGNNEDPREVGQKLGVDNILEGSVRREGNHVRITAELIKAKDGFQLWSQTYDREITNIFAVEDEIAQSATEALKLKLLGGNGQPVVSNSSSVNSKAYQNYLQALYYYNTRGESKNEDSKAFAYINKAIKLDEEYAPAWALRAEVQNYISESSDTNHAEGFRRARADAEHAIELDPNLAEAYVALATEQFYFEWDWGAASTSIMKAATLAPGSVGVLRIRSILADTLGNFDKAIKIHKEIVALDPLRGNPHKVLGIELYETGRYDEADGMLQEALNLNPQVSFAHFYRALILLDKGKPQQALAEMELEPTEGVKLTGQAVAYHSLGREQDSNAALANLIAKYDNTYSFQIAGVYAFRGETDKSFEWLERAYLQRDVGLTEIKSDPLLKSLRHDPRYFEVLRKMHLPV